MKLPDFSRDERLNRLRDGMGAPLVKFDPVQWQGMDTDDLLDRLKSTGVEVEVGEIDVDKDGTFAYRGHKVLVYIKDQRYNPNGKKNEYKFHLCNCQTIEDFRAKKMIDRYVVSRRTDGTFLVNEYNVVTRQYSSKDKYKQLSVCKNCLKQLSFNGYSDHFRHGHIYSAFRLEDFFNQYTSSQFHTTPTRYSDNAQLDEYTPDFTEISNAFRKSVDWRCSVCFISLRDNKHFLHVHHVNGLKWDNQFANLKAVCIGCHAEEAGHQRMKFTSEYKTFIDRYGNYWGVLREANRN